MADLDDNKIALAIGLNVLAAQERQREFVATHFPIWKETGKKFRNARLILHISRKDMSSAIGISCKTLDRFEKGLNVKSRKILEAAYRTALQKVQLEHHVAALSV